MLDELAYSLHKVSKRVDLTSNFTYIVDCLDLSISRKLYETLKL